MAQKEKGKKGGETQMSLREQLLGRLADDTGKKREVSVMTRMSGDIVEIIDALVELNIFKSRSEAVAAFVEQAIAAREPMFDEIKTQASEIRKLRDSAKRQAFAAFQEESK